MIALINDFDNKLFELNGIKYVRNFQAIKSGDSVKVCNAYDSRFVLVVAHYSEYVINGSTQNTADSVISILSPILFVKDELAMSAPGESTNNIVNAIFSNIYGTWINTPITPGTSVVNLDITNAVNGGICAVYFKGTEVIYAGGVVVIQSGQLIQNELAVVWLIYDKQSNSFNANIQTGFIELPNTDPNPAKPIIIDVYLSGGDITKPAKPIIQNVT